MKNQDYLENKLKELKSDDRMTYPAATVFSNAPLALHQTGQEAKIHLLEEILELPYSKFPLPKSKKKN